MSPYLSIGHSWVPFQRDCLSKTCNLLISKISRLAAVRCPAGLAFDIFGQTCNWKAKVDNCDRLSSEFRNYFSSHTTRQHKDRKTPISQWHLLRGQESASQPQDWRAGLPRWPTAVWKRWVSKKCSIKNNFVTFFRQTYALQKFATKKKSDMFICTWKLVVHSTVAVVHIM